VANKYLVIAQGTDDEWQKYGSMVGYVPDPMILRAGELFLSGRGGCRETFTIDGKPPGDDVLDTLWQALDANIHGILTFFNLLMLRDAIPLLDYKHTYRRQGVPWIYEKLSPLLVEVNVWSPVYEAFRNTAQKVLPRLRVEDVDRDDVADVNMELRAFAHEWFPELGDLAFDGEDRVRVAGFLLGGLIFGAYADASDSEHVLQNKRSRIFTALTRPNRRRGEVQYEHEDELFQELVEACRRSGMVRVDEIPPIPSILPWLLLGSRTAPQTTEDLLKRALDLRESKNGVAYRGWFSGLREKLRLGQYADNERADIEAVRKEIIHRLNAQHPKWSVPIELDVKIKPELSVAAGAAAVALGEVGIKVKEPVRLSIPDWVRNWILDALPFQRHRKLLLRSALGQVAYRDVGLALRELWLES
jgi:hypothetical protein